MFSIETKPNKRVKKALEKNRFKTEIIEVKSKYAIKAIKKYAKMMKNG